MNYMNELIEKANEQYDGHFTLMKFTTNWRCCFGTVQEREDIELMASGKTMDEAIKNCLDNNVDLYKSRKI